MIRFRPQDDVDFDIPEPPPPEHVEEDEVASDGTEKDEEEDADLDEGEEPLEEAFEDPQQPCHDDNFSSSYFAFVPWSGRHGRGRRDQGGLFQLMQLLVHFVF